MSSPTTTPPLSPSYTPTTTRQPYAPGHLLSPLEASILNEYATLRTNLDALARELEALAGAPSSGIADGLRMLERKTTLVCTALKSSVYGIVLEQEVGFGG